MYSARLVLLASFVAVTSSCGADQEMVEIARTYTALANNPLGNRVLMHTIPIRDGAGDIIDYRTVPRQCPPLCCIQGLQCTRDTFPSRGTRYALAACAVVGTAMGTGLYYYACFINPPWCS